MFSFIHSTGHDLNINLITHSYLTRGSQSFILSLHKFNFTSAMLSFYGTVPRQWNQLPNNVSIITDLNKFLHAIHHISSYLILRKIILKLQLMNGAIFWKKKQAGKPSVQAAAFNISLSILIAVLSLLYYFLDHHF